MMPEAEGSPVESRYVRVGYICEPLSAMARVQEESLLSSEGQVIWDAWAGRTVSLTVENLSDQMVELLFGLCSDCWFHLPVCDCHERGRE